MLSTQNPTALPENAALPCGAQCTSDLASGAWTWTTIGSATVMHAAGEHVRGLHEQEEARKPGQKHATPSPGAADRVFYETLLEQRPDRYTRINSSLVMLWAS